MDFSVSFKTTIYIHIMYKFNLFSKYLLACIPNKMLNLSQWKISLFRYSQPSLMISNQQQKTQMNQFIGHTLEILFIHTTIYMVTVQVVFLFTRNYSI